MKPIILIKSVKTVGGRSDHISKNNLNSDEKKELKKTVNDNKKNLDNNPNISKIRKYLNINENPPEFHQKSHKNLNIFDQIKEFHKKSQKHINFNDKIQFFHQKSHKDIKMDEQFKEFEYKTQKNIHEKIKDIQKKTQVRVNLRAVEENLKQKLLEMNKDQELDDKKITSPIMNRKLNQALMEKFDIKNENNMNDLFSLDDNNNKLNEKRRNSYNIPVKKIECSRNSIKKKIKKYKSISSRDLNDLKFFNNNNNNLIDDSNNNNHNNIETKESKKDKSKYLIENKYRILNKIKNLYDSMVDNETEDDIKDEGVINPETRFIIYFDLLIILFYLYTFVIITFRFSRLKSLCNFDDNLKFNDLIFYINDLIYIFDMIFSFFRGYYNFEFKLVNKFNLIIKNYITGHFILDLLEAIPVFTINKFICLNKSNNDNSCYAYEMNSIYFLFIFAYNFKILKIIKILGTKKNQALDIFFELISKYYTLERITYLIIDAMIYLGILHCFVCWHIFLGKHSYSNWIIVTNLEDKPFLQIYLTSFYFLITTITTVGYGDITCYSFTERIYQIILLAIGSIFYSYIVSTISNFVKNDSNAKVKYENDLHILENIRKTNRNMPYKLYKNILKHIERKSNCQEKNDTHSLIETLPFTLKNKILFTMYKSVIRNFRFFKKNDNSEFIIQVLNSFIPHKSKRNEFLIYEGEILEEMIFIKDGKISLDAAINLENPSISINKYFYEKFNEFTTIQEKKDYESQINSNNLISKTGYKTNSSISIDPEKRNINKALQEIISQLTLNNQKLNLNINNIKDICKFDVNGGVIKNEDGTHQYLKIIDIRKNEHYGVVYITLNKPSPLSLKVRSKFAELYLLKREEVLNLSKNYSNIWKKLYEKEINNIKSIKNRTFKALKKYIEINQLLINLNLDDTMNYNMDITLNDLNKLKKTICSEKLISLRSFRRTTSSKKSKKKTKIENNDLINKRPKRFSLVNLNERNRTLSFRFKRFSCDKARSRKNSNKEDLLSIFENYHRTTNPNKRQSKNMNNIQKIVRFNNDTNAKRVNSAETTNHFLNQQKDKQFLFKGKDIKKGNENNKDNKIKKLKKLKHFLLNIKNKLLIRKIRHEYKYKGILRKKRRSSVMNIDKKDNKSFNSNNLNKNITSSSKDLISVNLNNSDNQKDNNDSLIKELNNYYDEETNFSFCSFNEEKTFNLNDLSISRNIHLHIKSSYDNLNQLSKGKYISDKDFQNKIKKNINRYYSLNNNNENTLSLNSLNIPSHLENNSNLKKDNEKKHIKKKKKTNNNNIKIKTKSEITIKEKKKNKINKHYSLKNLSNNQFLNHINISKENINSNSNIKSDHHKNELNNKKTSFNTLKHIKNKKKINSKKSVNKSLNINNKKNKIIFAQSKSEFEMSKVINNQNSSLRNIGDLKSNNIKDINVKNNKIYKEKNHDYKINNEFYKKEKDHNKQNVNDILGTPIPNSNIILNNIQTFSSDINENTNNKINNIEASFRIYNIIHKNVNKQLNIFNNNDKNTNSSSSKGLCYIY